MAEAHPVGFQWVVEAKRRGATVIHVDPRFTRTSALADLHVPLRAGADIVFLGGIINYVLANEKYFRDYVVNYTNAAVILTEDFADTEDLDGVFSGLDAERHRYDLSAWSYAGAMVRAAAGSRGAPYRKDPGAAGDDARAPQVAESLEHPRCVFQVLKRHFARYTPEVVEQACGVPPETFVRVCELLTANSGRDRTTALVYSVGWTQHTVGVQYIRTAAILQALLGNMGRQRTRGAVPRPERAHPGGQGNGLRHPPRASAARARAAPPGARIRRAGRNHRGHRRGMNWRLPLLWATVGIYPPVRFPAAANWR
jgi:formate dehydrogenase major subunit